MDLKASGQEPEQTIRHISCFEESLSVYSAGAKEFTADLAARIAERFVLRRDHVDLVLKEARYAALLASRADPQATQPQEPVGELVPPDGDPISGTNPLPDELSGTYPLDMAPGEVGELNSGAPVDDYQPMGVDPEDLA